jgi:hypothetical protein
MKSVDDNDLVRQRGRDALDPLAGEIIQFPAPNRMVESPDPGSINDLIEPGPTPASTDSVWLDPPASWSQLTAPPEVDAPPIDPPACWPAPPEMDAPPMRLQVAPRAASPKRSDRPQIIVRTDERAVIDEAISALAKHPDIYHRGGLLVHVIRDQGKLSRIIRPPGAPRIVPMPLARLRELLSDSAKWAKITDGALDAAHPPDWAVRGVDARGSWPELRPLEAIVETPVLRPDGTVISQPGYDEATGILFVPSTEFPACPEHPTFDDVRRARDLLHDTVVDFPFASPPHASSWFSAVLTPLARFAFRGPAPLHLIDANVRGAGKSLLADTIAEIVTGRPMARMAPSEDDAEERKRITAIALGGDNVAGPLGTPSLDAALTSTEWRDRLLGTNNTIQCPLLAVWFATGNNIMLSGDTSRRCLHIRLESPEECPEERSAFHHPDLLAWVRENRPALVTAALTILRGYCAAGRPELDIPGWGSFDGWSRLIRHALVWSGEADPGITRKELRNESDRDAAALANLISGWEAVAGEFGGQCTVSQALFELDGLINQGKHESLRAALDELVPMPPGKLPSAHRIGKVLSRFRGRVVGGRAIVKATGRTMNGVAWRVQRVESPIEDA